MVAGTYFYPRYQTLRMLPRRDFFKLTGLAALANGLSNFCMPFQPHPAAETRQATLLPKRLQAGNNVALIAPSSPVAEEKLTKAIANLSALGLTISEGKNLRNRAGYLAGSDSERLADLHAAFENPEIDAIWCVRGGYGAARLLPAVNFSLIKKNPKLLIGYSDITALHLAIHAQTGLVTFHGPVGAGDFTEMTLHHLKSVVMNAPDRHEISAVPDTTLGEEYQPYTITPGIVRGALTGGNLALLSSMAGTPFAPKFRNKIVFIEDVGEQPYRLDRMFTQLLQSTDLAKAAGIALGVFNECQPKNDSFSYSLRESLQLCLGYLNIPVVYGIPFGHISNQATLPYGIQAELNATEQKLTLLEPAVR